MRPTLLVPLALLLAALPAHARRCDVDGVEVNPDNGATTAGRTGTLTCRDDDGRKQFEHELRDGVHVGLERSWGYDGTLTERTVDARGNTDGRRREFWPDGTLKSDALYADGDAVGVAKSFHRNGTLAALRWYPPGVTRAGATLEWDDAGRLKDFACAAQSVVPEDRAPCGFGGTPVETPLHGRGGLVVEKRTVRDGVVLLRAGYGDQGQLQQTVETTPRGRIERVFHPNGERASEKVVDGDWIVARSEWYMNGAPKSKTTTEPAERDERTVREAYRDTGVLQEREETRGRRPVRRETFDEAGVRTEELVYAAEGHVERRRTFAPDGRVTLEEALYPDGSRKVLRVAR